MEAVWGLWVWSLVAIAGFPNGTARTEYQWVYHTSFKTEKRCLEVGKEVAESTHIYRGQSTVSPNPVRCRKLD